ncbi:ATP dependent RNA helicase (Dbp8), putative [Penicillium digitatum]|uniref:RNA helicase n=3 Tax=Penicillium digitatum TaxID=36651 RepID=K9G1C0_PEND2|nr:ATP dependent RNA helicase (Dbp8), putative [Penicillium digitatum Pd1]EKV07293.1 ATP dependent RNA helicase (Dbp8), putative [Penicillium digitatum Pd1]EKV08673.1 ATP dependent RNA helicase (Dbp8), putative [Penicillium digitatum PHI26]QQK41122.1 ATP dependent RNA helicase (Dbp8), putative [Penicillium digitatum]
MAPPITENPEFEDSDVSDNSDVEQADVDDRAPKRRRLSESSNDSYVAPAPLPTLSRIKKKGEVEAEPESKEEEPVLISDAIELGKKSGLSTFAELDVAPWLVSSLTAMAIKRPTAIQKACIPEILKGKDCIGGSRTGSGKTMAFAVPIMQQWARNPFGIYALVLTPTRELALQIYEQFRAVSAPQNMKPILVVGGVDMRQQAIELANRPHVVIATPGRLADHIKTSGVDTVAGLRRVKMVVLDEADRLLASGPGSMLPDVETCLGALPPSAERQTLLFTATMTAEVRALKSMPAAGNKPPIFTTEIGTENQGKIPPTLKQTYLKVPMTHREAFLHALLSTEVNVTKPVIVFCNHTKTCDLLERTLRRLGHRITSLHSILPQSERTANLARFRATAARVLVATDVASRGLDIPSVELVINFDVPRNPDDYVHRVGRTARAGRSGEATTLVGQRDVELVLAIEERVGRQMEEFEQEGVNIESRVVRTGLLKEVGSAKREAAGEIDEGRDILGRKRNKLKKVR